MNYLLFVCHIKPFHVRRLRSQVLPLTSCRSPTFWQFPQFLTIPSASVSKSTSDNFLCFSFWTTIDNSQFPLFQFLNDKAPMWDTEDSLIGTNPGSRIRIFHLFPQSWYLALKLFISEVFSQMRHFSGMGYRPHPHDSKIESTLIWYRCDHNNINLMQMCFLIMMSSGTER